MTEAVAFKTAESRPVMKATMRDRQVGTDTGGEVCVCVRVCVSWSQKHTSQAKVNEGKSHYLNVLTFPDLFRVRLFGTKTKPSPSTSPLQGMLITMMLCWPSTHTHRPPSSSDGEISKLCCPLLGEDRRGKTGVGGIAFFLREKPSKRQTCPPTR